ncbi:hypothetical protein SCUP234_09357 [Seiridium cupressi]
MGRHINGQARPLSRKQLEVIRPAAGAPSFLFPRDRDRLTDRPSGPHLHAGHCHSRHALARQSQSSPIQSNPAQRVPSYQDWTVLAPPPPSAAAVTCVRLHLRLPAAIHHHEPPGVTQYGLSTTTNDVLPVHPLLSTLICIHDSPHSPPLLHPPALFIWNLGHFLVVCILWRISGV